MRKFGFKPQGILFDLDGTLADTGADLAAPVNAMRVERGLAPLPLQDLKPYASAGARGLIGKGLGVGKDAPEFEALKNDFLARYERDMMVHTHIYDGFTEVLLKLAAEEITWGVVSNKIERYVRPIMHALGLAHRSACIVGGDTSGFAKPHPEPLLYGCREANIDPKLSVYVGDDLRDIQAGRAAGMITIAAAYGFCGDELPPSEWGADFVIFHPRELISLL
jgi:N-acetyl-D-muramate 6-phosphate phosphatase